MTEKHIERTLVLHKPDAVQRGLVGEIISRFERKGLKIVAMKMVWPDADIAKRHYDQPESAMLLLGNRTIAGYKEKGQEPWTEDPIEIAKDIQSKLVRFLTTGPIIAMVLEGAHAVAYVRQLRGATSPHLADIGTIAGDLAVDSYFLADDGKRVTRNLVHASGTVEEAEHEIGIWFEEDEIMEYKLAIHDVLYSADWENNDRESLRQ